MACFRIQDFPSPSFPDPARFLITAVGCAILAERVLDPVFPWFRLSDRDVQAVGQPCQAQELRAEWRPQVAVPRIMWLPTWCPSHRAICADIARDPHATDRISSRTRRRRIRSGPGPVEEERSRCFKHVIAHLLPGIPFP